ncbi:MAG TPA: WD40 repeat domain-containing protein [Kofleriaceae bacterium]
MAKAKAKKPVKKVAAKAKKPAGKKPVPKKKASPKKKPALKKQPVPKRKPAPKKTPAVRKSAAPAKKAKEQDPTKPTFTWSTRDDLAQKWNELGRAHFTRYSEQLAKLYAGEHVEIDGKDPRSEADGDAVVEHVIALNKTGEGERVRELFDPAHTPLMGWIKSNEAQLGNVAMMGADDILVRQGSPWQHDGATYYLHGSTATVMPDMLGFRRSRNRDHIVVARGDGLYFYDAREGVAGLGRAPRAKLAWPAMSSLEPAGMNAEQKAEWAENQDDDKRLLVEHLRISDDGMRVVMTAYRQGILLASLHPGHAPWTLVYPNLSEPWTKPGSGYTRAGDMTHADISRDGTRLAFGSQDSPHFAATINDRGEVEHYATIGNLSEYPHDACFSDSGKSVTFNSCHFYNGATILFQWDGNQGKELDAYEQHPEAPCIDGNLRVYASCFLPADLASAIINEPTDRGAFLLAGSGIMRIISGAKGMVSVQGFGSSASAVDYDPEEKRLVLSSYSGYVHVYDLSQAEEPGRIDGVNARKETARWALWPRLPNGPVRW